MKIEDYKKLSESINNQNFNKGYKNINTLMFVLSIFGHFASIFLAYFMLSKIFFEVMTDNVFVVFFATIILLSGLELLKRDIFDKFSIQYLKTKSLTKDVLPLFLLSLFIISLSFYASISGAKEFSSKSTQIENNKKELVQAYDDSLSIIYSQKTLNIEEEIKAYKTKIEEKDKEQLIINKSLQDKGFLNSSERERNKQLAIEKSDLDSKVKENESKIKDINDEKNTKVAEYEEKVTLESNDKKTDNGKNSLMFIIISTLIELVILAGVYFNKYYKYRSYNEFKTKVERDPNYQKWVAYESILSVIYSKDSGINDKIPSNKNIVDMCKVNDVVVLPKDITDFMKLMINLKIIRSSGSSRYISKSKDIAFEMLKSHFNIQ